jgi:hypothetical protein
MAIKYTNTFHFKTLQNLPKLGFLVRKETIWQPWFDRAKKMAPFKSEMDFAARQKWFDA